MKRVMKPVLFVIAAIYLAVDELFSFIARPIADWLARLRILDRVRARIAALPPYPALALFLIPLIILEPVKPASAYLAATGHLLEATVLFVVGELLKLVLVERLFQLTREQLMTIPAFAWCYLWLRAVLDWIEALPPWRMLRAKVAALKTALRERFRKA
jgi:hypothetical protein